MAAFNTAKMRSKNGKFLGRALSLKTFGGICFKMSVLKTSKCSPTVTDQKNKTKKIQQRNNSLFKLAMAIR